MFKTDREIYLRQILQMYLTTVQGEKVPYLKKTDISVTIRELKQLLLL
jgi:hypothetical protein